MDTKAGQTVMWCGACWAYVEWIHTCKGAKRPFCKCTPEEECAFHKRGGYVTYEDDIE